MINKLFQTILNFKDIPKNIWALGFVSMFMDVASILVHSLLPIFLVSTIGVSVSSVGLIEAIAESSALIVKIFSGYISDYLGKRKLLVIIGYGLSASAYFIFPMAKMMGIVLFARFVDRIGKGVRDAPRDALIGDIAPPKLRGACFGLRQSLDTVGGIIGSVLAFIGMYYFANNIRDVLWIALVPAFLALWVLVYKVKEPEVIQKNELNSLIHFNQLPKMGRSFWMIVSVAALFGLGRFSEAFLILKAYEMGVPLGLVPLIIVLMKIVYSIGAYPAGVLSDTKDRRKVLMLGMVFLITASFILGSAQNLWLVVLGTIFWGLHLSCTEGILAAMVADAAPANLRGTAFGIFDFMSGISMFFANIMAGVLWDGFGSSIAFFTSSFFGGLALLFMLVIYFKFDKSQIFPKT